ncbi:MAG TPA: hypothetical protein VLG47_07530 [Candidatus Saccharimonadales bacterium]|nr:hypothetical protein [Candidatus Saccharimonadales bacterium]
MFRTLKKRIALVSTTAIVLASGVGLTVGSSTAFAASGSQYCTTTPYVACLNAWNGGPFVNVYTARGTTNNDFTVFQVNGIWAIKYTGDNGAVGRCVGDANNDPNLAYTSLDVCPTPGDSGGWGTNFDVDPGCGTGKVAFKNRHWPNGWLKPNANQNGAKFYLNGPTRVCYTIYPAA